MSIGSARAGGVAAQPRTGARGPNARVLVVFQRGRGGAAALREAGELAAAGAELTVVTLAPQAKPLKCCGGGGAGPYNCAVREEAHDELREARSLLGSLAARTTFTTLFGIPAPPLAQWSAEHAFDVILLPAQRLARGGGALARELRRGTRAEVGPVR